MSVVTLEWQEFLQEATEFQKIAERLGDTWTLCKMNDEDGYTYLIYEQKIPNVIDTAKSNERLEDNSYGLDDATAVVTQTSNELLKIEYHIVYSISYQVPVLYFRIYRSDGSLVGLEDAWRLFPGYNTNNSSGGASEPGQQTDADMLSILTQMDHPILRKPYFAIHPCRTAELLGQAGKSRNRLLTFISLMGPYVQLVLRNDYGVPFAEG